MQDAPPFLFLSFFPGSSHICISIWLYMSSWKSLARSLTSFFSSYCTLCLATAKPREDTSAQLASISSPFLSLLFSFFVPLWLRADTITLIMTERRTWQGERELKTREKERGKGGGRRTERGRGRKREAVEFGFREGERESVHGPEWEGDGETGRKTERKNISLHFRVWIWNRKSLQKTSINKEKGKRKEEIFLLWTQTRGSRFIPRSYSIFPFISFYLFLSLSFSPLFSVFKGREAHSEGETRIQTAQREEEDERERAEEGQNHKTTAFRSRCLLSHLFCVCCLMHSTCIPSSHFPWPTCFVVHLLPCTSNFLSVRFLPFVVFSFSHMYVCPSHILFRDSYSIAPKESKKEM